MKIIMAVTTAILCLAVCVCGIMSKACMCGTTSHKCLLCLEPNFHALSLTRSKPTWLQHELKFKAKRYFCSINTDTDINMWNKYWRCKKLFLLLFFGFFFFCVCVGCWLLFCFSVLHCLSRKFRSLFLDKGQRFQPLSFFSSLLLT